MSYPYKAATPVSFVVRKSPLPVKKGSNNHGTVEQDPAQARQVDIFVAFLYAVP